MGREGFGGLECLHRGKKNNLYSWGGEWTSVISLKTKRFDVDGRNHLDEGGGPMDRSTFCIGPMPSHSNDSFLSLIRYLDVLGRPAY